MNSELKQSQVKYDCHSEGEARRISINEVALALGRFFVEFIPRNEGLRFTQNDNII